MAESPATTPVTALGAKVKGLVVSARRRRFGGRRRRDEGAGEVPARVERYRIIEHVVPGSESSADENDVGVRVDSSDLRRALDAASTPSQALPHDACSGGLISLVSLDGSGGDVVHGGDGREEEEEEEAPDHAVEHLQFNDVWETFVDTHDPQVAEQMRADAALARSLQEMEDTTVYSEDEAESYAQQPSVVTRAAIMTADGRRVTIPHIAGRSDSIQPTTAAIAQAIRRGMEEHPSGGDNGFVTLAPAGAGADGYDDDDVGGATMAEVAMLPVRTMESAPAAGTTAQPHCSICLMDCVEGENVMTLPCMHGFHAECVSHWLSLKRSCPVCKHVACGT